MADADLYSALGVNRGAPMDVIRRAYRKAAKGAHPDAGGSAERWSLVCLAHDILTDPRKRKSYDETGTADDIEAHAMQSVYDAVAMVVATIVNMRGDVDTFDVVGDAIKVLRQQIQNVAAAERQHRSAAAAIDKALARFKAKKGKRNDLKRILGPDFQGHLRAEKSFATQREICERAIAILQDHTFEFTPRPEWGW